MTEKEASIKFFGTKERSNYFNKMKVQLRTQLGHLLIAWPSSPDNKYRAAYEECYKDFTVYKLLLMKGKRKTAIEIAKSLIPRLEKSEIHSLLHLVAHDLHFHFGSIKGNSRAMKKYERIAGRQLEIMRAESMIRMYHTRVGFICNTRDSFTPSIVKEIEQAADHVTPLLQLGSSHLNRFIYTIIISRYAVVYDNENIIRYCNEALASIPKNHPKGKSFRFSFMYKKVLPLLALEQIVEAKAIAKEICQMMSVGGFNWHTALFKRLIICFHSGEYQEAYELYKAHKQKTYPNTTISDYWKILHGYLYFLIQAGKIEPYSEERFNLGKFLNDTPVHAKDKAGQNISILIIQILTWMQRDQFGKVIDRIESLREYARNYTLNPETKRANIFINMIIKMEKAQFHRSATELKTKSLYQKLKAIPLKFGQNLAIEIIPYPVLWEEILSMLRDQPRARTIKKTTTR